MSSWNEFKNRLTVRRRPFARRRASVLVIVVAILTIIALMGTAYIATARIDRYSAQSHVQQTSLDATRNQFISQVEAMVQASITNDPNRNVTSARLQPWLGDRLPRDLNAAVGINPMWRFMSGALENLNADTSLPPDADSVARTYVSPLNNPNLPAQPANVIISPTYPNPNIPAELATLKTFLYPTGPSSGQPLNRPGIAPSSISLTYPGSYSVTALQNKTRTYPAATFVNALGAPLSGQFMAADADGDGIADAVLFQLTPAPIDGVTYYAAVRIVDNNSAINVNTAWSRDTDFNVVYDGSMVTTDAYPAPAPFSYAFFPSNIGLIELLDQTPNDPPNNGVSNTGNRYAVDEMKMLNTYRFGYTSKYNDIFYPHPPLPPPLAKNHPLSYQQAPDHSLSVYEDNATVNGQVVTPPRSDFQYISDGEALWMNMGRRLNNPAWNQDDTYTPPGGALKDPFRYQAYSAADGATLAYHFMMAPLDADLVRPSTTSELGTLSDVELRLQHSSVESAPNFTFDVNKRWTRFMPNDVQFWWFMLNYDAGQTYTLGQFSTLVTSNPPPVADSTSVKIGGQIGSLPAGTHFRGIRPLLTTWNPVSSQMVVKGNALGYPWLYGPSNTRVNDANLIYPGMLNTNSAKYLSNWVAAPSLPYLLGDIVRDNAGATPSQLTYMYVGPAPANPNPGVYLNHDPGGTGANPPPFGAWEPLNHVSPSSATNPGGLMPVTGLTKANINIAGFPELWRAFTMVMTDASSSDALSTPFDTDWVTFAGLAKPNDVVANVTAADPFLGNHFTFTGYEQVNFPYAVASSPYPNCDPTYQSHPLRMFRSPIRDHLGSGLTVERLTPQQVKVLRAAIASVNAMDLRTMGIDDTDYPGGGVPTQQKQSRKIVTSRTVTLYDVSPTTANPTASPSNPLPHYHATVYGTKLQPFITEVYVNNDNVTPYVKDIDKTTSAKTLAFENPNGYVAIELFNPFPEDIDLSSYQVGYIDRAAFPALAITPIATLSGSLASGTHMVLENFDPTHPSAARQPVDANYRPRHLPLFGGTTLFIANLHTALGHEFVLLRPRDEANVEPNLDDNVPADSYDFTNIAAARDKAGLFHNYHYVRQHDTGPSRWNCVYPGRYDPSVADGVGLGANKMPSQQGTVVSAGWLGSPATDPSPGDIDAVGPPVQRNPKADVWNPGPGSTAPINPPITLGNDDGAVLNYTYQAGGLVNTFCIPLAQKDWPGFNRAHRAASPANQFPFGGFARNGDMLQVPFIGAYRIRLATPTGAVPAGDYDPGVDAGPGAFVEMNSVSMDAAFAEDTYSNDNDPATSPLVENIGRFCPNGIDTTLPLPGGQALQYRWTAQLFNYLTVQNPATDYTPNVNPQTYSPYIAPTSDNSTAVTAMRPQPVSNSAGGTPATANQTNEDGVPIHGLINICTAPPSVLEMLPMASDGAGSVNAAANKIVAKDITLFRDGMNATVASNATTPFTSIFDLNEVVKNGTAVRSFQTANATYDPKTADATNGLGDFSPYGASAPTDGIINDFEQQFLMMNRISNLVTTKSDTFTVYIVIQGWREANTAYPSLDWEKRIAYIADRSASNTAGGSMTITPVPSD